MIQGTLRRHFRDSGWALRVPRQVHELAKPQQGAPTLAEVADLMSVPLCHLEAAERARHARSTTSIGSTDVDGGEPGPSLGHLDAGLVGAEKGMALRRGLAQLGDDDVRLLSWYYFEEETQSRIAERLGCSQMQVSRLLALAIQRLRPFLSPNL